MNFKHWSNHPDLKNRSFLAINVTNHNDQTRQFNDGLFSDKWTGRWDIQQEVTDAGLVTESIQRSRHASVPVHFSEILEKLAGVKIDSSSNKRAYNKEKTPVSLRWAKKATYRLPFLGA